MILVINVITEDKFNGRLITGSRMVPLLAASALIKTPIVPILLPSLMED